MNYTTSEENVTIHDIDIGDHSLTFQVPFQNISHKARFLFRYCNYETYAIGATCAEGYWDSEEDELAGSWQARSARRCTRSWTTAQYSMPSLEGTAFTRFVEDDYSVRLPDWEDADVGGEETVVALVYGPCAAFLNKYNSPSDNLYGWIED